MEKFVGRFNIKPLLYEPLYKITEIVKKIDKKLIVLRKDIYIKQEKENFLNILE